jgi:integrase
MSRPANRKYGEDHDAGRAGTGQKLDRLLEGRSGDADEARHDPRNRPGRHTKVERFLEADAFPYIGNLPIRSVTAAHLLEIVRRLEKRGAATVALLVRQWCSAIFRYAVATLRADSDPAAALKGAISRPKIAHSKPLSRDQIAAFVKALGWLRRVPNDGHRAAPETAHLRAHHRTARGGMAGD